MSRSIRRPTRGPIITPAAPGQIELGRILADELRALGLADVEQDEHGLVLATVPADLHRACAGRRPQLPPRHVAGNQRARTCGRRSSADYARRRHPAAGARPTASSAWPTTPNWISYYGRTLITTDGTTLLGADDKAGVAIIMEVVQHLMEHPEIPHGPVRMLFTCDEEIGRGVDHVDLKKLAADVCYTLDGPAAGHIDVETFSADLATIQFRGVNHPSRDRLSDAWSMPSRPPRPSSNDCRPNVYRPKRHAKREGFLHPYAIDGGVGRSAAEGSAARLRYAASASSTPTCCASSPPRSPRVSRLRNRRPRRRSVSQSGAMVSARNRGRSPIAEDRPSASGLSLLSVDHSRRHRRLAPHRTRTAHAQSLVRTTQSPFATGMGLSGRNAAGGRSRRRIAAGLGRIA